jgi:outer membrane lipoprotein-sorting protein
MYAIKPKDNEVVVVDDTFYVFYNKKTKRIMFILPSEAKVKRIIVDGVDGLREIERNLKKVPDGT